MRPEQAILIASTGLTLEDVARHTIEDALAERPDWTSVVSMALEHGMTPALLAALEVVDQSLVPSELLIALREHCNALRDRSLYLVAELHAILESLERESVEAIAFKGPLLAELLFDDVGKRLPGDLDLLVHPGDVSRVCELIEARGYVDNLRGAASLTPAQHRIYRRSQCEYQFVRVSDGVIVEPHWAFAQRLLAIDLDYHGMFDRARSISLGGRQIRSLATEDLLLTLCVHGGKHRWERLAWIRDVSALLARWPDLNLDSCIALARSTGCARLLLLGLTLARRCAHVRLPAGIDRLIDADETIVALEKQVMMGLFDPVKPPFHLAKVDRFLFRLRERWPDRMRYVCRTLLMPHSGHIEMVALPSPFLWAYYPLRWSHDYVALPLWRLAKPIVRPQADFEEP
jgi:putative nucleotidyltransferase-like protein